MHGEGAAWAPIGRNAQAKVMVARGLGASLSSRLGTAAGNRVAPMQRAIQMPIP
jgi:hypothetical protein